ncbi:hypothetical protein N7508_002158 [Penicillium antarcticum]|uniref:uncharacterized protein n=1 Tax=Penicillium antarcticum TaxID=416450 RepID=UPI002381E054|nr:uncharacterized protein N7508_002158 [Penicillium antarcticum]KAJ5317650.1 hypothetical protein N7508_002158 [Penicillium antarcticum]
MGKRVPRSKVREDGIPIDPALTDQAFFAPNPFHSSPSAPSQTPPHWSGVNQSPLVHTALQTESPNQVRLQQALTQAALSMKDVEAKSYQLQRQIAAQAAQLREAESAIDHQQQFVEESTSTAKHLRANVSQQLANTEAREEHISLLEMRLAETNAQNARISVLAQERTDSYNQQVLAMVSRIVELERGIEDANTDLLNHKMLVKAEKQDWRQLHDAMKETENRRSDNFLRMTDAVSHLDEMISVLSDKINGFERTMTNPYPRGEVAVPNSSRQQGRPNVSPAFSIQDLNLPANPNFSAAQPTTINPLFAAQPVIDNNNPCAAQPAILKNEATMSLAADIQPQFLGSPAPSSESSVDSLSYQLLAAVDAFERTDWYDERGIPYNEEYELGLHLREVHMSDAPENVMPVNTEITNAPVDMAAGSGSGLGILPDDVLASIAGALEHEEQRQRFMIHDSGARSFADAPATTQFHQPSEVPIVDVTMTDAPPTNLDLLPPSSHIAWNGVLDPAASALSAPERKRSRQVHGFWEPDNRSAKSWDGNLHVKRVKLAIPLSRPRYLNARKRWVKAVKSRVRAPIPTTPAWTMPTVVSFSAIFGSAPAQVNLTMAASTDPIVVPAPIIEQPVIASVLTEQAIAKEAESERPRAPRPRIQGPGPRTYPVYKAYSVLDPDAFDVPVPRNQSSQHSRIAKDLSEIRWAQAHSARLRQAQPVNPISSVRASAVVPGRFGLQDAHVNPRKTKGSRVEQLRAEQVNCPHMVDSGLETPVSAPTVPDHAVAEVDSPKAAFSGGIRQLMSLLFWFLSTAYYVIVKVSGYSLVSVMILMAVLIPLFPVFVKFILTVMQAIWQETRLKALGLVFSLAPNVTPISRAMLVSMGFVQRHYPSRLLLILALLVLIEYVVYSTQWKGYERQYIRHLDYLRYGRFREWPWLEKIDFWVTRWLADHRGTQG